MKKTIKKAPAKKVVKAPIKKSAQQVKQKPKASAPKTSTLKSAQTHKKTVAKPILQKSKPAPQPQAKAAAPAKPFTPPKAAALAPKPAANVAAKPVVAPSLKPIAATPKKVLDEDRILDEIAKRANLLDIVNNYLLKELERAGVENIRAKELLLSVEIKLPGM